MKIPNADRTEKLAISPELCRIFFSAPLPESKFKSPLPEFGCDIAKMILCLAGINTVDLYELKKEDYHDGTTETITDKDATQLCADRIDEIRQDFKDWASNKMQQDTELGRKYEKIYSDQFNNYVPKHIPDDFVPEYFTGATHTIKLRTHQAKAAIRGTMQNLMLAHEVGSGKTFTLISTAMGMLRLVSLLLRLSSYTQMPRY